jgi:hypothetical protein
LTAIESLQKRVQNVVRLQERFQNDLIKGDILSEAEPGVAMAHPKKMKISRVLLSRCVKLFSERGWSSG